MICIERNLTSLCLVTCFYANVSTYLSMYHNFCQSDKITYSSSLSFTEYGQEQKKMGVFFQKKVFLGPHGFCKVCPYYLSRKYIPDICTLCTRYTYSSLCHFCFVKYLFQQFFLFIYENFNQFLIIKYLIYLQRSCNSTELV